MKVLGIDPGYGRMGVAVIESLDGQDNLLFSTCFETSNDADFPERLAYLSGECESVINKYKPEGLGVEKLFFTNNAKTAMRVAEVRGMIISLAKQKKLSVREFSPQDVKIAVTGSGNAGKEAVINMIPRLIKLSKKPKYDDEYDAIAVALAFIHSKI